MRVAGCGSFAPAAGRDPGPSPMAPAGRLALLDSGPPWGARHPAPAASRQPASTIATNTTPDRAASFMVGFGIVQPACQNANRASLLRSAERDRQGAEARSGSAGRLLRGLRRAHLAARPAVL